MTDQPEPACLHMTELFYGEELDLRDEIGREEREEVAKTVCVEECNLRFACLEYALQTNQEYGVWGGMSQGERREFKVYLRKQGHRELPSGKELRANVNIYEGDDGRLRPKPDRNSDSRVDRRHSSPSLYSDETTDGEAEIG